MNKKILFVTATTLESDVLKNVAGISSLVTGVGPISTLYNMFKWIQENGKPDIAINAGIAGCFGDDLKPGEVVIIKNDCFADLGIEDGDSFLTLAETCLLDPNEFPFVDGRIPADEKFISMFSGTLPAVNAVTVSTTTGSDKTCRQLMQKFNPSVESMEGASFFYLCRRESIPYLALRAVSNNVGPRNRDEWKIKPALDNLSARLKDILKTLK